MKKIFNIKKYILVFLVALVLIPTLNSCKDELDDMFYDPGKQTKASFEMLFTGVLCSSELFRPEYGPAYHQIRCFSRLLGMGTFPTSGNNNANVDAIKLETGWSGVTLRETQFNKAYSQFNKNVPIMNLLFNGLSEQEKKDYEIYVLCVNVVQAYFMQRITDIYDDVPFSEANGAYQNKFLAKYDSQKDIYYTLLANLKTIGTKLNGYQLNTSVAHVRFFSADILNNGDLTKWCKMANSLRLRMAMRLSVVDPEKSKAEIKDILDNNLPLVTESADFIGMEEKNKIQAAEVTWFRAMFMGESGYNAYANNFMLKNILGYTNGTATPQNQIDPRMYVIYQPNIKGAYLGLDSWNSTVPDVLKSDLVKVGMPNAQTDVDKIMNWDFDDDKEPMLSCANKMTYFNYDNKFFVITPTEINLLLAEAALRFPELATKIDVKASYLKAINISIDWYYNANASNKYTTTSSPLIKPDIMPGSIVAKDVAKITNFIAYKDAKFAAMTKDEKIKEIYQQKFVHLNYFDLFEVWSETRRLKKEYGDLSGRPKVVKWMDRFMYPAMEEIQNAENFKAVSKQNNVDTPVWWTGRKQ